MGQPLLIGRKVLDLVGEAQVARNGCPEHPHRPLDEAQIRFRRAPRQWIGRWRRRSGAIRACLLLLGAGGGLLLLVAYGWYVARRIAEAWCWGCG